MEATAETSICDLDICWVHGEQHVGVLEERVSVEIDARSFWSLGIGGNKC